MSVFERLLNNVIEHGERRSDRRSLWAPSPLVYSLERSVPLITSKRIDWQPTARELLWMLRGETNISKIGHPATEAIWAEFADEQGDLGATYGAQYRNAGGFWTKFGADQLSDVVYKLAGDPDTTSAVINLWSPSELDFTEVEPNTTTLHFSLRGARRSELHLQAYRREANMVTEAPYGWFRDALLLRLVAREISLHARRGITAGTLTWNVGDAYVLEDHLDAALAQLTQHAISPSPMTARLTIDPFPSLRILKGTLETGHMRVDNYFPNMAIKPRTRTEAA